MEYILESPRFLIRQITHDDLKGMYLMDAEPDVHKYLGNQPVKFVDESNYIIDKILKQYEAFGIGRWAVIEKSSNEFVGWTGFKFITTPVNNRQEFYDFGYRFRSKYWGQGIATETAIACLDYASKNLNIPALYAIAHVGNIGSNKVLNKVGFKCTEVFDYDDSMQCNWYEFETWGLQKQ